MSTLHKVIVTAPDGVTTRGEVEISIAGDIIVTPELIEAFLDAHRGTRPEHKEGDVSITLPWNRYVDFIEAVGVKIAVLS